MSHADYLRELLRPLRVYELTGTANGGELDAVGEALDGSGAALDEVQREMLISTAEDWGLEAIESLLVRRPVAPNLNRRRQALAALLRIGGDSFTLEAINDNLKGCGLNAVAVETDTPGVVEVYFPDVPGIPDGFDEMKKILEEIQDGTFASKWINENKVGRPHFNACRRIEASHELESVGKELRKMYAWNDDNKYAE